MGKRIRIFLLLPLCLVFVPKIDRGSQVAGQLSDGVKKIWVARYKVKTQDDNISTLATDGKGNIYVAGTIRANALDYLILKYSPSGKLLWAKKYDGFGDDDHLYQMIVDAQGNLYVTGTSYGGASGNDIVTIKYDSYGNRKWVARYNDSEDDYDWGGGVVVDRSGNVYVTGTSRSKKLGEQTVTIKYDSSGRVLWTKLFDLFTQGILAELDDRGFEITLDKVGNVYVTGIIDLGTYDTVTVKYSPSGTRGWVARYGGSGDDRPKGIVTDAGGNVYVSIESWAGNTGQDIVTIKYNSAGVKKWSKRYAGTGNNYDGVGGLGLDAAGNILVTGYSSRDTRGYVTLKYDPAGNKKWVKFYDGKDHSGAAADALALDSSGNVYVTGSSQGLIETIKYDASGAERWNTSYALMTYDSVHIAIDSSNNVIVAGQKSQVDWEIIKYVQTQ